MKIGDTIKIKSTGRIYKVVGQEENQTEFVCEDVKRIYITFLPRK